MSEAYRRAGVDLDAGAKAVELIRDLAAGASRPELAEGVGGFAGSFELGDGRSLVAATDGVGTKIEIARLTGRLDTVGIDLVAMCADDVVCTGAEPLFFLDYLAVGRVVPERVAQVVAGVAEGCRLAGCALLGGETAEHPGVMAEDAFDLAGFCVGIVAGERRIGPHRVAEGDVLIGLASTGLHANGFSLVRRVLLDQEGWKLDQVDATLGRSLGEELLEPTAIYAPLVVGLVEEEILHAAAHITGGGIPGNVSRALPVGARADIRWGSWPEPAIFALLLAHVPEDDLRATLNLGLGMVLVVEAGLAGRVVERAEAAGVAAFEVGSVQGGPAAD